MVRPLALSGLWLLLLACGEAGSSGASSATATASALSAAPKATTSAPAAATANASASATASGAGAPTAGASAEPLAAGMRALPLPGAKAPVMLDFLAFEPTRGRVWLPVADTGSVAVFDPATSAFESVPGFKTAPRESRGKTRTAGPTAAAAGDGFVFVGNRGSNEVCAVDASSLAVGACVALESPLDAVAYVAGTREVWVTTPHAQSIAVLDASKPTALHAKATLKLAGEPEGYGFDAGRGLFFTNLEDADKTLSIDAKTHAVRATWEPGCGKEGPRGLAVDAARGFVVVACTDHLQVLDAGHDGAQLGKLETGAGVDNIDFAKGPSLVAAAAGKAARLTFARLDDKGQLTLVSTTTTVPGARSVVVDAQGQAYLADPQGARLLVVPPPARGASADGPAR